MKRIALAVLMTGTVFAQRPAEEASWAPKMEPAQYPPGHKPHTKLADLRAKYKGKSDWRDTIVSDTYFKAEYISMAPGARVEPRFHPDTRIWWIVMDGEIRFDIEGQDSFIARKGSMVQAPMQTIYSMQAIGDKPALRFEVSPAQGKTLYPRSVKPPEMPGIDWIPVVLGRKPQPYGYENKPHINLYDLAKTPGYRGGRFVHDDRGVANIIYGSEKNLPPLNPADKGHYHPECAEFWLIMTGQIRFPIEKVGTIIAEEGDVVYVPPFTFHAPRFHGEGPSCRLAMNGYPNISHLREAH
jgi:quercetin dioxygenase-like cupin family protein